MKQRIKQYGSIPAGGNLPRTRFDLGKRHKTTFEGDHLVPIYWRYAYPGEIWSGDVDAFIRMGSPLDTPLMDDMYVTVHWYKVAIRNLWDNYRKFFGEQDSPGASIDYSIPELGSTNNRDLVTLVTNETKLWRYMGIPQVSDFNEADASALPFRAYHQIYNWHYRDQQQGTPATVVTDDGPDDSVTYQLLFRNKRHDYFTAAMPAPQRGESVPVQQYLMHDVSVAGEVSALATADSSYHMFDSGAARIDVSATTGAETTALYTELEINDLRNAAAVQQFLEKDNRYGTRFDEQIRSHFGAEFNDIRIAPEFIGGGSGYITTSVIPNQSATTGNLGDLAAIATGSLNGAAKFTCAIDEPCIIMGIAMVTAQQSYQQGLPREFSERTRFDMFWPEFNNVGDQDVKNREIYYQNAAADAQAFGYVPRYEHLRTTPNQISGEFHSNDTNSLDSWHLGYDFGSLPVLGNTWIQASTPYSRIQAVTTNDDFYADFSINVSAARLLPTYGIPGMGRI